MEHFIILETINIIALLIGGLWAIYNFILKRDRFPKVEFNLDLRIIDKIEDKLVLEFIAYLENKGLARHYIDLNTFILKIRYITAKDLATLNNHTKLPFRKSGEKSMIDFFCLNFPHSIKTDIDKKNEVYWLPGEWDYIFIDGGTKQKVSLPLTITKEAKYLLVKSEFKYKDKRSGLHSAQAIFNIDELKNNI